MGCLTSAFKYFVFLINFLIIICSILLIVFGALLLTKGNVGSGNSRLVIGVGVIVLLVALFGCCGAIREDTRMLTIYGVILIIVFIIQLILAILLIVTVSNDGKAVIAGLAIGFSVIELVGAFLAFPFRNSIRRKCNYA